MDIICSSVAKNVQHVSVCMVKLSNTNRCRRQISLVPWMGHLKIRFLPQMPSQACLRLLNTSLGKGTQIIGVRL